MELTSPSPIAAVRLRPVRLSRERARAYRELAAWWLGSRLLVLAAAAVVQVAGWPRAGWHPSLFRHPFVLLTWWDGRWYGIVAKRGYLLVQGRFSQTAFFPFFPVLERAGHLLGLPVDVAGVLIAHLGFLAGLLAAYELARAYLPEADARRSSIYLAIFPFGFVFSMAYPEGVVLPLVALAGVLVLRERWLAAGICAAAATLARPEGILLAVPIGACARWPPCSRRRPRSARSPPTSGGRSATRSRGRRRSRPGGARSPRPASTARSSRSPRRRRTTTPGSTATPGSARCTCSCSGSRCGRGCRGAGSPPASGWCCCRSRAARSPRTRASACSRCRCSGGSPCSDGVPACTVRYSAPARRCSRRRC